LLKGHWCRLSCRIRGIRFRSGANLRVYGRLVIRGPGEVVFGENVVVNGVATPWTYTPEARIVVGDNVIMGPARFGCVREIVIGSDCLLGKAVLMDTDFHSTRADRRSAGAPVRVMPVRVGNNVWIGENAGILPGTTIGDNSVVGYGAVCMRDFPANVVILGNPAKVASPLPSAGADAPAEPAAPSRS
jgi:acetyltransferase-like isoleucine patch superfamily enzyme